MNCECWWNPETGQREYCREHEAEVADQVSEFDRLKWQKEQIEHKQQRAIERKVAEQCAKIAERKIDGTLPLTGEEIARIIRQEFGVNR